MVLERLLDTFGQIRSSRVCSCALWILSEYCTSAADIQAALQARAPTPLSCPCLLSTVLSCLPGCGGLLSLEGTKPYGGAMHLEAESGWTNVSECHELCEFLV